MHTAVMGGRKVLGLYVANGVTGVRDMAGEWDTLTAWRRDIAAGRLVGPRILASGPYLEGGDIQIPHLLARTPEEGRAAVDSLVAMGVDLVKVHSRLTPPVFFAIARRARERGIAFGGHVPRTVGSAAASDSGQREHRAPARDTDSVHARRIARAGAPLFGAGRARPMLVRRPLAAVREVRTQRNLGHADDDGGIRDRALAQSRAAGGHARSTHPRVLRAFVAELFPMPADVPADADVVGRAIFEKRLTQVAAMRRAGVRILTGTDAPLRNSPPGFGLHEEFVLLARGGMSPFEIIRAATFEPAAFFNALDSAGTVAPGKVADLVLLDANPLENIRNTTRISAVVANGVLIDRRRRRELLERAVAQ